MLYCDSRVKTVLLQALVNEPEKSVKNSIVQLIGTIANHELPGHGVGWPELLEFVQNTTTSTSINEQEVIF